MKGLLWTAITVCVCCCAALPAVAADSAEGYRLAGTVAVGRDFIAFLALPGGDQALVRNGDVIGNARVAAIGDRVIELVLPTGRVELSLAGSGEHVAAVPAHDVITSESSQDQVLEREVDAQAFGKSVADTPRTRGEPGTVLARTFAPVLNLPANGRVLSVNGKNVTSVERAIRTIEKSLASGGIVYMNLDTPNGIQRVYLTPQRRDDATTPSSP